MEGWKCQAHHVERRMSPSIWMLMRKEIFIPGRSGREMVECSLLNGSSISVAPLLRKWEAVESGTRLLSAERSLFFFMKAINGSSRQRRDMDDFVTRTD